MMDFNHARGVRPSLCWQCCGTGRTTQRDSDMSSRIRAEFRQESLTAVSARRNTTDVASLTAYLEVTESQRLHQGLEPEQSMIDTPPIRDPARTVTLRPAT